MLSQNTGVFAFLIAFLLVNIVYFTESIPRSLNLAHKIHLTLSGTNFTALVTPHQGDKYELVTSSGYHPTPATATSGPFNESNRTGVDLGDSFNGLTNLCNETKWTNGLWLHCHSRCGINGTSICGGLNNARNRVQTCIRLAIDTGSGLILPSATTREEKDLVQTNDKTVCPDVFWNTALLKTTLSKQCPQLQIRQCDDKTGIDKMIEGPVRAYLDPPYTTGVFRSLIDAAIETSNTSRANIDSSHPVVVEFGDPYIGWNYKDSGELSTIRKALFKVLEFNKNLLDLSSQVYQSPQLSQGEFIGVHLRGENDWPAGFGTAGDQMRLYVAEIERIRNASAQDTKTVYVSCGDPAAIQIFRDKLLPMGYIVHDKWTLLAGQPKILAQVEALNFDEKGIVEYQTLVNAKFWMGIITSSMSSLIAYARSVDEEEDYFTAHIFPGSSRMGFNRVYSESPAMRGDEVTKLMVVSGPDIMEAFP